MELREGMSWPPLPAEVSRDMGEWDAWWSGSKHKLASVYGSQTSRNSGIYGRLVRPVSRMLWGETPRAEDRRVHLPLPADIASASSDLLFGDELAIDWGEGADAERMEAVLGGISWQSLLAEAGEVCAALGGVYLRAGWDLSVADHPMASVVAPDAALGEFSYGLLQRVTFWTTYEVDHTTYRHTETHEPGRIVHQLWKGSVDKLGSLVPLTEIPQTVWLADVLDDGDTIETGTDVLTAAYIPNIRPVPLWRRLPGARYLGRSDFGVEGVPGLFDSIDETWTSWMRDIRHGRSRIFVASQLLSSEGPGRGAFLDLGREVYEAVKIPFGEDPSVSEMISAQQFNIRVEEHSRTIRELTLAAVSSCGYSGSTFGLDTEVAKTATEVAAVRGRTVSTRAKKARYWTPALERFLFALQELDRTIFGGPSYPSRPRVSFPPVFTPTRLELAQTAQQLKAAEAASTETLVRLVNPEWDDDQVLAEVDRIKGDAPAPLEIGSPFTPDVAGE